MKTECFCVEHGLHIETLKTRLEQTEASRDNYQRIANERAVSLAELKGEVDRLRISWSELQTAYDDAIEASNEIGYACMSAGDVIRNQNDELVEAHALLQKRGTLLGLARRALKGLAKSGPVIDQIDAALSASTEPSAPVEIDHDAPAAPCSCWLQSGEPPCTDCPNRAALERKP